jgi:hypothetical protein
MAITSRDVPTAVAMSKPRASTSAGTTTNPPPTPKNPVTSPTTVAAITTRTGDTGEAAGAREGACGGDWRTASPPLKVLEPSWSSWPVESSGMHLVADGPAAARGSGAGAAAERCRYSMAAAAPAMSTENAASRALGSMLADRRLPAKAPPAPRTPNTLPERTRTRPARRWTAMATSEVTPTMISDPVVALCALWPSR